MSLAVLADHLASKGRNGDTMLVHMTPEEVGGLHALALAHGGSLTVNPETGLVEASFLKRLLPAIAGFALAPLTAGTSLAFLGATPFASALTIGGITGLATGSLRQGIMAGLGAYGGASLGAGLQQAGMAGTQAAAGEAALKTAAEQIASPTEAMQYVQQKVAEKAAAMTPFEAMKAGASSLGTEAGRQNLAAAFGGATGAGAAQGAMRAGMMAAAPALLEPPKTTTPQPGMGFQYTPRVRPMSWNQYTGGLEQLPMFSAINRAGATPQEKQPPEGFKGGGIVALADGGFTDERVAQALRESMGQGFSLEQSLGGAANKFGISQEQLARAQALMNAPAAAAPVAAAPVAADLAAGLPAITAAQQQTFAPNVFTPGSLRSDVYGAFLKGQETGNFADLQREINEGKLTSTDVAALFPQLTKSGVEQFGQERGLTFGAQPQRLGWREMESDNPLNRAANLQSDVFVQGINTALQQAGAPALDMPALQAQADLAQPYRYRDAIAEAFDTAQMTGDYSNFNALMAERDVSKTELRNIFQNVTNPAIAEFEQRGVEFSALPDWIGQKGKVDARGQFTPDTAPIDFGGDVKVGIPEAENYARKWLDVYGRDISPQEMRELVAAKIKPDEFKPISIADLTPDASQTQLARAGVLPYLAANPNRYDWQAIAAADDPIAAIQSANRLLAMPGTSSFYKDLGEVGGLKVQVHQPPGTQKDGGSLLLNGQSVGDAAGLYKAATLYGLGADEINRLADIMEQSGVRFKPGEVTPGINIGIDPREVAAGSYGTLDYERFSDRPEFSKRNPETQWYASQLGLAYNRNVLPKIGQPMFTAETLRPSLDRLGNPLPYGVIGGGGETASFFSDPQDAATRSIQQGVYGPVTDLRGRSPYLDYKNPERRPGDVIATPRATPRTALEYVQATAEAAPVSAAPKSQTAASAPSSLAAASPETFVRSTDPTQQAKPTAAQLAAQRSIVADPVAAARQAALSGVRAGMTDQQIADMVNLQYGKTFSAQNVADFMRTQGITRPTATRTPEVTRVDPFRPVAPTMDAIRKEYEQGGGSTRMPTITDIQPTDRTYTQNQAFSLLEGYLRTNPNALYSDVVSFARSQGIPEMQARAAFNEFRFSGLTGGSKAAYDYLMGRGAYPVNQSLPGGAPIMRPYAEASGLANYSRTTGAGGFFGRKTIPTEPTRAEAQSTGKGTTTGGKSGTVVWENTVTGARTVDIPSRYADDPEWRVVETKAAGGGLMDIATIAAAQGGDVQRYNLGGYSDGGRLLRGPGDGVSDSIPATIGNRQPARLADGEFVVPARIVSEIGNGSTEAGARKLYKMMERVQRARAKTVGKGRSKVAKDTGAEQYLPA